MALWGRNMTRRSLLKIPKYLSANSCLQHQTGCLRSQEGQFCWDWARKVCQEQLYTDSQAAHRILDQPKPLLASQAFSWSQQRQLFGESAPANRHHERKLLGWVTSCDYSVPKLETLAEFPVQGLAMASKHTTVGMHKSQFSGSEPGLAVPQMPQETY